MITHARWLWLDRLRRNAGPAAALAELLTPDPSAAFPAEILGAAAAWALDAWRLDEARGLIERLEDVDPWRAGVERMWLAYRSGQSSPEASVLELEAASLDRGWAERWRLCLAAGKQASDGGDLDAARSWCLAAAAAGRRAQDDDLLAASFGALAEVLYVGGSPLHAFDMLGVDLALLPRGSSEGDRLRVYRAHCLRQLGQWDAAEGLYTEVVWRADLAGGDATWAIRGLCWLDSLRAVAGTRGIRRGADRIEALESATPPNPHALAHSLVARSFTRAGGDAEADQARAAALFADAGYTQEPALLRGLEPAVSAASSPAHHPPDLCDRWILGLELRTRRETLALAARALDGQGPAQDRATAWMGAFF